MRHRSSGFAGLSRRLSVLVLLLATVAGGCGSGDDGSSPPPFIAVLSAFPAELAPLVERATIDEKLEIDGRIFRLGRLGRTRVVLALTGIGLVNAESTTRILLDHFAVTGVVFSGVAGSFLRIGDVAVPERWTSVEGDEYGADAEWLERAEKIAERGNVVLEECTVPPSSTTGELVCLPHQPGIFVGGLGRSSDPFGGSALACQPNGQFYPDVFGCDVDAGCDGVLREAEEYGFSAKTVSESLAAEDMETTAVAREAAARGLPFIAFRAVSDGAGDPLDLPGFPAQFFAYYRLAGHNAAAATIAFLETIA
jgi:nucleoside phosphorylase